MVKKDNQEELLKKRFQTSYFLVFLVGLVLLWRLFDLQIVQGTTYESEAKANRTRVIPIAAARGRILDINGVELAITRSAYTVSLLDQGNGNVEQVIPLLAGILKIDQEEITEKMDNDFSRMTPIRLTHGITDEQHVRLSENMEKLPGVYIDYVPVERVYPQGSLLSHTLGFLGALDPEDLLEDWSKDYSPDELVGKQGIERSQEKWLRGTPGGILVEVDAQDNIVRELTRIPAVPGHDIYLTIDSNFQRLAEETLIKSLSTVRMQPLLDYRAAHAYSGSIVALNPVNGSILAMASYPDFDPNAWSSGSLRDPKLRELYMEYQYNEETGEADYQINEAYHAPMFNRAILEALPPGSIYKPVTLAAALECEVVSLTETVQCTGIYNRFDDVKPKCWIYPRGAHGFVHGSNALRDSCNCYFFEMGYRLGPERLDQYAAAFGLGEDTGFRDLYYTPEDDIESTHRANPSYKKWAYENGLSIDEDWYDGETISAAIGQSFNAFTPLQMAMMTMQIANEGERYRPYLINKIIAPDDKIVYQARVEVISTLQLKDSTWKAIHNGLVSVTKLSGTSYSATFGSGGTIRLWEGLEINVAAKTGTAQIPNDPNDERAHAWFSAFAPAEDPQIAIAMVIENGRSGSYACAPTVSTLIRNYLQQPKLSLGFIEDSAHPWPVR